MEGQSTLGAAALPVITVITPTCGRPAGMALAERWMARQTVKPDRWIVADGGETPAPLTMGQERRWSPSAPGPANFAGNVLRALEGVTGAVVVFEDDDYYAPDHIEQCFKGLEKGDHGCEWLRYWNVQFKAWKEVRNKGSSLAQTATRDIPRLRAAAEAALAAGDYTIDGRFWDGRKARGPKTVVGIKGLPGIKGLGMGHRPGKGWHQDPAGRKLREWIGTDAEAYR